MRDADLRKVRTRDVGATSFSGFVPLPSNERAMDALLRWACRAQNAASPVVLVGPSGVGKTHLVRSALAVRQGLSMGQRPRLLSAANLMAACATALGRQQIGELRARLHDNRGCIVLEHLEDLAGKPAARRELFAMLGPSSQERNLLLTVTQRRAHPLPAALLRDVIAAFPRALIVRIPRPKPRDRRRVAAYVVERMRVGDPDAVFARVLSGFVDDEMEELRCRRLVLVLDESVMPLQTALEEACFYIIPSGKRLDDLGARAALISNRIVVTRDTERYLDDAPILDYGIIGLDALPEDGAADVLVNATGRLISRAALDFSIAEKRGAFLLLLHPMGRHVFRRLG